MTHRSHHQTYSSGRPNEDARAAWNRRSEPPGAGSLRNSTNASLQFKDQCRRAQSEVVPETEATPIIVGPSMVQVYRGEVNHPATLPTEDPVQSNTQRDKHEASSSSFSDKWKWPITFLLALLIVATAATVGAIFGTRKADNSLLRASPNTNTPTEAPPSPIATPAPVTPAIPTQPVTAPALEPPQEAPSTENLPIQLTTKSLFGVTWTGNVVSIDRLTGASRVIGPAGHGRINSAAQDSLGRVFASSANGPSLIQIDPLTGRGTAISTLTGDCVDIRGLAFNSQDVLYALCFPDQLYKVDITTGASSNNVTAPRSIQGLEFDQNDNLYAISVVNRFFQLDTTGLNEKVILDSGVFENADQALHYDRATGKMLACGGDLVEIDIENGSAKLIGPVGGDGSYIRGLFEA